MHGLNISIYEREVHGQRGEVASAVPTTTPGDQHAYWRVHANRRRPHASLRDGGYWTIVFQVWPANHSRWHLSPHSWIGDRRRSLSPIPIRFDLLESATIPFRSNNRPFSNPNCDVLSVLSFYSPVWRPVRFVFIYSALISTWLTFWSEIYCHYSHVAC